MTVHATIYSLDQGDAILSDGCIIRLMTPGEYREVQWRVAECLQRMQDSFDNPERGTR